MSYEQTIKKVLALIEQTGDRCIIVDPTQGNSFALLTLAEYEKLVQGRQTGRELTQNSGLGTMEHEIAEETVEYPMDFGSGPDFQDKDTEEEEVEEPSEAWVPPQDDTLPTDTYQETSWDSTPKSVQEQSSPAEEEQFYLEPVE